MTGDIWLASGIHTGTNAANVWTSGAWWAGALVKTSGHALVPDWTINIVWTLVSAIGVAYLLHREKTSQGDYGHKLDVFSGLFEHAPRDGPVSVGSVSAFEFTVALAACRIPADAGRP